MWTVEFNSNTVHVDKELKLSPKKKLQIKKYLGTCGRGLRSNNSLSNQDNDDKNV